MIINLPHNECEVIFTHSKRIDLSLLLVYHDDNYPGSADKLLLCFTVCSNTISSVL